MHNLRGRCKKRKKGKERLLEEPVFLFLTFSPQSPSPFPFPTYPEPLSMPAMQANLSQNQNVFLTLS